MKEKRMWIFFLCLRKEFKGKLFVKQRMRPPNHPPPLHSIFSILNLVGVYVVAYVVGSTLLACGILANNFPNRSYVESLKHYNKRMQLTNIDRMCKWLYNEKCFQRFGIDSLFTDNVDVSFKYFIPLQSARHRLLH